MPINLIVTNICKVRSVLENIPKTKIAWIDRYFSGNQSFFIRKVKVKEKSFLCLSYKRTVTSKWAVKVTVRKDSNEVDVYFDDNKASKTAQKIADKLNEVWDNFVINLIQD